MSTVKKIDIAVIGNNGSGKTFVIDAIYRLLGGLDYEKTNILISDKIKVVENTRVGNDQIIKEMLTKLGISIHDSFCEHKIPSENRDEESSYGLKHLSILSTEEVGKKINIKDYQKTELSKDKYFKNYYWCEIKDQSAKTFLSMMNIPGEAIELLFNSIKEKEHSSVKPFDILNDYNIPDFYEININDVDDNQIWIQFKNSLAKYKVDPTLQEKYYNNFFYWLYVLSSNNIVYCDGNAGESIYKQISSSYLSRLPSKNKYRVFTKIDAEFASNVLNSNVLPDTLDSFYSYLIRNQNEILNNAYLEYLNKIGSENLFNKKSDVKDFFASTCYDCNKVKFVNLDTSNWEFTTNDFSTNKSIDNHRFSVGVRQLISTIFYNNDIEPHSMGNLNIEDEFLRDLYYS